jgi:amino acid transporter
MSDNKHLKSLGSAAVFTTAISTTLGAVLFLRFGYAVGMIGFLGTIGIVLLGHMVTIPAAFAISELATNQRVEGGGEYFVISRSFGLNIGATIGIALFMSQAVSVAFYIIAFTEAFAPLLDKLPMSAEWSRRIVSIPSMLLLSYMSIRYRAKIGVKTLFIVMAILGISLFLFFIGKTEYQPESYTSLFSLRQGNLQKSFFIVFAIVFPAFTGMTAGVGLSGVLKNPGKSIPVGTIAATLTGLVVYIFVALKLALSASTDNLVADQLIMSKIAVFGSVVIPLGLAASTLSAAIGSIMVAPRTLQALALDESIPLRQLNRKLSKGHGKTNEPRNATLFTCLIAFIFVFIGGIDFVAQIISMFFMITYGFLCLISFLYHFGANPSYHPEFRSRWYLSLTGFICCVWLIFKMQPYYALLSVIVMFLLYRIIHHQHSERGGITTIFLNAIFQLNRNVRIFLQHKRKAEGDGPWRPSVICISKHTFNNSGALKVLGWLSYRYGFGTYIHLIDGYFSNASVAEASDIRSRIIKLADKNNKSYIATLVSPSYTSAIAQSIQLPGVSGMVNNLMLFEFEKERLELVNPIISNIALTKAAGLDIAIFANSSRTKPLGKDIHVWIQSTDYENSSLMILLSYSIQGHPDWKGSEIRIFEIADEKKAENARAKLTGMIQYGRLPISPMNIEVIAQDENRSLKNMICSCSKNAGLTLIGFLEEQLKHDRNVFSGYEELGDVMFINTSQLREIG